MSECKNCPPSPKKVAIEQKWLLVEVLLCTGNEIEQPCFTPVNPCYENKSQSLLVNTPV